MVKVYRSDCWDEGNALTRFMEYTRSCGLCGEVMEMVGREDESVLCCDCMATRIEEILFLEWFLLMYREDVLSWVRFRKLFSVCVSVYLLVMKNLKYGVSYG